MISNLVSLQFDYASKGFEENFKTLKTLVEKTEKNSLVLAPELCLSGYKFENLKQSADFSQKILPEIKELSKEKTLSLTMTQEMDGKFYNNAKIFHDGKEIYSQPKVKLFKLGNEQDYFQPGKDKDINLIEINSIKVAILICFELRFIELWQRVKGADIILIPSYWGKPRKTQLETLSTALAVANQCFVILSNSSDEDMASSSAIITPFGDVSKDDDAQIITTKFDKHLIKKMRRYLDIGL